MEKWDVVRIFCTDLIRPHDKFCICVCPDRNLFMFVNSEPPMFRKARDLAVQISNFEAIFLQRDSFVDTTTLVHFDAETVTGAWGDEDRRHGKLSPQLRQRICDGVNAHEVLSPEQRSLFEPPPANV